MTDDELYWLAAEGMKKSRVYGLGSTAGSFYGSASSVPSSASASQQHATAPQSAASVDPVLLSVVQATVDTAFEQRASSSQHTTADQEYLRSEITRDIMRMLGDRFQVHIDVLTRAVRQTGVQVPTMSFPEDEVVPPQPFIYRGIHLLYLLHPSRPLLHQ